MSKSHPLSNKDKIDFEELSLLNSNEMWLLKEGHCFRSQVIDIWGDTELNDKNKIVLKAGASKL